MAPGTYTFLFTDIEGSTRRWQEDPAGMRAALELHDGLLRKTVVSHGGTVAKHTGDGMLAVFDAPDVGLSAAVDAQRGLRDADWGPFGPLLVRMALHSGVAEERDGDYFGTTLNRAARLLDAGHGGQMLCAGVTAQLAWDQLPPGLELVDLGDHRLRDLAAPERVFQVVAPDLPDRFPPLRSLTAARHNLPIVPTALFGRAQELADLAELLGSTRLVSLIGVGGVGKTRLALELAARVVERFPDGVFFVELAAVTDPESVPAAVAAAVGVPGSIAGAASTRDVLLGALTPQRLLVVLDNCEHLVDGCAELVGDILSTAPGVSVLTTSREALGIPGEQFWPVRPLDVGGAADAAVRLFVARAAALRPGFQLAAGDHETAVAICRRLDGLPLAIELAAARVGHLTLNQIADRLDDRFRLLTGGRRRVERHQTLRATIGWSHDLLDEPERRLLRRLGVFAGPFTLEAVEGICFPDTDSGDALALLSGLVDRSLVVADLDTEPARYRLLETVRAFAEEELAEAGESDVLRDRHRDWFTEFLGDDADPVGESAWDRILPLYGNVRAAIEWSLERGEHEQAARLLTRSTPHFFGTADIEDRVRWFRLALGPGGDIPDELLAHTYGLFAATAVMAATADAADVAIAATTVPALPHPGAWTMRALMESIPAVIDPSLEGPVRAHIERALEGIRHGPIGKGMSAALKSILSQALLDLRKLDEAIALAQEALDGINDRHEHWTADLQARATIATAAHLLGRYDEGYALVGQLLDEYEEGALPDVGLAMHGVQLIAALAASGRAAEARRLARRMAEAVRRTGLPLGRTECLLGLGIIASLDGDPERASRLLGTALAQGSIPFLFRSPSSGFLYLHHRDRVRAALGPDRARALRDEGRALGYEEALALGLGED